MVRCLFIILFLSCLACAESSEDVKLKVIEHYASAAKYPQYFAAEEVIISNKLDSVWYNFPEYYKKEKELLYLIDNPKSASGLDRGKDKKYFEVALEELRSTKKHEAYSPSYAPGYLYKIRYKFKDPDDGVVKTKTASGVAFNRRYWKITDSTDTWSRN